MTRIRIKICGITTPADAELAARLGADAIGLNFYSESIRSIDMPTAMSILEVLPPFVEPVALFVNSAIAQIQATALALAVNTVQIHGTLPAPPPWDDLSWIIAHSVRDAQDLQAIRDSLDEARSVSRLPAAILIDARVLGMYGGTGQTAPWHLLADFKPGVPLILAGGLTPENVSDAIRIVRPYAVDVASGVESAPGKKDPEKLRRFIDVVRNA